MKYLEIEKYEYALIVSSRKLRPYFNAHNVIVLTNQPLKYFLQNSDASKWVIEQSEFRIIFAPRIAVKGQALANFIVESIGPHVNEVSHIKKIVKVEDTWELQMYGSSSKESSGASLVLTPLNGNEALRYSLVSMFSTTNIETEYDAIITGLRLARCVGVTSLRVKCGSQLVVN